MGRPWWYDSYWEKQQPRRRRRVPARRLLAWLALVLLSAVLAFAGGGVRAGAVMLAVLFVDNLCRILSLAVLVRALLTWFPVGGYNRFVMALDDVTEPVLAPLRRVIPMIGRFDVSPLVAIILLNAVPALLRAILR